MIKSPPSPAPVATGQRAGEALRAWTLGTALAALTITGLEAALLQQKKAFFTGGFLTAVHAGSLAEGAGFLLLSLAVDLGVLGLLAALVVAMSGRWPLTRAARVVLVFAGSLAPLLAWNFIEYSLLTYLGDTFDLGLMFELTGRSASEVLAVASGHLLAPLIAAGVGAIGIIALVAVVNRVGGQPRHRAAASKRLLVLAAAAFVIALMLFATTSATSDLAEDGLRRKGSGQALTHLFAALTDFDGDGFGIGGRLADPAPFNGSIYPYALEQPGNGIDENAAAGDLPAAQPAYEEADTPSRPWTLKPDVVLVVLESFRGDLVGRQVNGRDVTPVLGLLAREGISSSRAFSHNGYTTQSRFHLMTGSLAGLRHGSLVDDFKAQGYETAYFSAQDESFGGPALGVGFDRADVRYDARDDRDRRYSTFTTAGSLAVSHVTLRERIQAFLERRSKDRPLFLYVNFHDTHFPYHHRDIAPLVSERRVSQAEITPANNAAVRETYDNTAANVDRAVGATLDLVARATGRPPAVIVTADHGESLFDEGFLGHGYALNDAQTRIPLIVRGLPLEVVEPFGQVDLRDTLDAAMRTDPMADRRPRIRQDPSKTVLQYLGNLDRPRQLGWVTGGSRVLYDFRDRQVIGPAAQVTELVHIWERMLLARAASGLGRDE